MVAIQQHKLWLVNQGYAPKTVRSSISNMKSLSRHSDLGDPDSVKQEIAKRDCSESNKQKLVIAYDRWVKHHKLIWSKPRYRRVDKLPYVPTEKDIDQLIGGMSKRLGTVLLFIKETGCRLGEMWSVKWSDIDADRNMVTINQPEKGSRARQIRVSSRLLSLVYQLRARRVRG